MKARPGPGETSHTAEITNNPQPINSSYITVLFLQCEPSKDSPDSATSDMGTFCSYAMKPKIEKMAKPATKLVPLFRKHRDTQSLQTGGTT